MMTKLTSPELRAREVIAEYAELDGLALPILHALQAEFGYVPATAAPVVADALNLSRAEIYGIVSVYHDFQSEPVPARMVKHCRAETCQA